MVWFGFGFSHPGLAEGGGGLPYENDEDARRLS